MNNWLKAEQLSIILNEELSLKNATLSIVSSIELAVDLKTEIVFFTTYYGWLEISKRIIKDGIIKIAVITNIPIPPEPNDNFSDHVRYVVRNYIDKQKQQHPKGTYKYFVSYSYSISTDKFAGRLELLRNEKIDFSAIEWIENKLKQDIKADWVMITNYIPMD